MSDSAEAEQQVDLSEMSYSDLQDRVMSLVAERARLEGQYLAALGEMASRCGPQGAAHGLREYTRMTSTQARHDARLADLAVDAQVLPAVFSTDWSRLAMGRTRNASDAQRLVLAARDRGCIGCDLTSEHTQSHHIQYFEHGGHTDIPNLASLCEPCHRGLHQHDHGIYTPTDGRPRIRPPTERSGRSTGSAPVTARSP
ncbi:HNH endonuclease signature motif containing protein [Candidatus Poriferisodalis sp.]|uniref:HNH endonuclease signature motif containing protein n=1 Tax=Candidatus Poriferisodalis sp. TaxID=3101277 RepID=UPI003B5225AC